MKQLRKMVLGAILACSMQVSHAGVIDLGFLLDSSGSINSQNWEIMTDGFKDAIGILPTDGTYRLTFYGFGSQAYEIVGPTLIDSAASLTLVQNTLEAQAFGGGFTNTADSFNDLLSAWTGLVDFDNDLQLINIATDGNPTCIATDTTTAQCQSSSNVTAESDALAAAAAAISAGVDSISAEAIGNNVDTAFLLDMISPYDGVDGLYFPGDALPDPLEESFVLRVNSFDDFGGAITQKIQRITGQVPEPNVLFLFGVGLLGMSIVGARKKAK